MMKKKWLLYVLFIMILSVCFLYYLFPADQIKNYMAFHINKAYPEINITIDRIKPAFPPGMRLFNVSVYQMNDALLILKNIKIVPDLLSLLRSNTTFFFKANTCDGMIAGKGELTHNSSISKVNVDATFSDIQISKIDAIQSLNSRNISGVLEGHLVYSHGESSGEEIKATLIIADGSIELLNPILLLETVTFNILESDIIVKNKKVQFKQCRLKGHQMDGSIAGSIILKKPMERSVLNLAGTIRPHLTFLANLQKDLPKNLIPKKFFSKNGMRIKLSGTIEKPVFSMN